MTKSHQRAELPDPGPAAGVCVCVGGGGAEPSRHNQWHWRVLSWSHLEVVSVEVEQLSTPDVVHEEDVSVLSQADAVEPLRHVVRVPLQSRHCNTKPTVHCQNRQGLLTKTSQTAS